MTVVQTGLASSLAQEAKFIDTLVSSNLVMAPVPGKGIAICKLEAAGGATFQLAYWPRESAPSTLPKNAQQQCLAAAQGTQSPKGRAPSPAAPDSGVYDLELQVPTIELPDTNRHKRRSRKPKDTGSEIKVSIALRSTEAIIYYLGQIARANTDLDDPAPVNTIERDMQGKSANIPLFQVQREPGNTESAVAVEYEGRTYSVPAICDEKSRSEQRCTIERPIHRSLDVLTLVTQLWGLQKEATTQPPAPVVTVINP